MRVLALLAMRELRDRRRSSLFVISLFALPFALLVLGAVLVASTQFPAALQISGQFGNAKTIAVLPASSAGDRLVDTLTRNGQSVLEERETAVVRLQSGERLRVDLSDLPLDDALVHPVQVLHEGRAPSAASEVALSERLRQRLDVDLNDRVTLLEGEPPLTVVGLVRAPVSRNSVTAIFPPGTLPRFAGEDALRRVYRTRGLTRTELKQLHAVQGYQSTPTSVTRAGLITDGNAALAYGASAFALLECMLLAGAAFAVSAARQRRQMALLQAAAGATAGQLRQLVLMSSFVVSICGCILGFGLGLGLAAAVLPAVQNLADYDLPGLATPWRIVGASAVAVLATGVLAALGPAIQAGRVPPLQTASEPPPRALNRVAGSAAAFGIAVALVALVICFYSGYSNRYLVLGLAMFAATATVATAPPAAAAIGRCAARLPATAAIGLRDLGRNPSRSGAAVSAVALALAGAVAASLFFASDIATQRSEFQPAVNRDALLLRPSFGTLNPALADAVAQQLAGTAVPLRYATAAKGPVDVAARADSNPRGRIAVLPSAALSRLANSTSALPPDTVALFNPQLLQPGSGDRTLLVVEGPVRRVQPVPAVVVRVSTATELPTAAVTEQTAAHLGLRVGPSEASIVFVSKIPTEQQVTAARQLLISEPGVDLLLSYRYDNYANRYVLFSLLAAGLTAVIATIAAVGLTAGEVEQDLRTLQAVGASPGFARRVLAAQAGGLGLLGSALGTLLGLCLGLALLLLRLDQSVLHVPVTAIAAALVATCVTSTAAGGVLTRANLTARR